MEKEDEFKKLISVMQRLRGEGGCPWDREQTHESIRSYCIEEAYEVVEAIDKKDMKGLCEELGDLMLQVVFHAQMAKDAGYFSVEDVLQVLNEKLIRRHPHVFDKGGSSEDVKTAQDVVEKWSDIKKKEGRKHVLDGLPKHLPALQTAFRMGEKLSNIGFDWDDASAACEKIGEELDELASANDQAAREEEFGDLLFTLCQWARHQGIEPESALRRSNAKFESRVRWMEEKAQAEQAELSSMTLEKLESLWTQAKRDACAKGSLS